MNDSAILGLRAFLVAAAGATVLLQVAILPTMAADYASWYPEAAEARYPMLLFAVLFLTCAQIVVVCTWRLLTMVRESRIFRPSSRRDVNVMIGAFVGAGTLALGSLLYVVVAGVTWSPGVAILQVAGAGICFGIAMLLVVMRQLLTHATALRTEMDEVV